MPQSKSPKLDALLNFMLERHRVYLRRAAGNAPPWTKDTIIQRYRFTNVYRERDKVTVWIRQNIREPYTDHPALWFMLCIARQINWPDTLAELIADREGAWPQVLNHGKLLTRLHWDWERACAIMRDRQRRGLKLYTSAYMLRGPIQGDPSGHQDKAHYTTLRVLQPTWKACNKIEPQLHNTLEQAHTAFLPHHGWGGFLAYEVVTDLRWTRYLHSAPDINTWAYAGPGAKRGLNRVFGRPFRKALHDQQALDEMRLLYKEIKARWPRPGAGDGDWPPLEMREIEMTLCEFDKYERARLGEGRPKQMFKVE
mgnify:CR=1 FL=1